MITQNEKDAVKRVMDSGVLSDYLGSWGAGFYGGQEIKALEKEWAEFFGVKHAIACNSATSGLWMALHAVGLNPMRNMQADYMDIYGDLVYTPDEIVVTAYSMTCSASLPLLFGAKPIFADIEDEYYCLDPESVRKAITPRTKAILVVDLFGHPYDSKAINAIGKEFGIPIIEDAAQSIGAKANGKYAGTLGDIGAFSLNFHKHIHAGEGGVVVTDNDDYAMRLRLAMNHGDAVTNGMEMAGEEELAEQYAGMLPGMNLRMTEMQAAVAREQLKRVPEILPKYQEMGAMLKCKVRPGCEHAFYRYANPEIPEIEEFMYILETKNHYVKPIYLMPTFRKLGYKPGLCPVCEAVDEKIKLAWMKVPF